MHHPGPAAAEERHDRAERGRSVASTVTIGETARVELPGPTPPDGPSAGRSVATASCSMCSATAEWSCEVRDRDHTTEQRHAAVTAMIGAQRRRRLGSPDRSATQESSDSNVGASGAASSRRGINTRIRSSCSWSWSSSSSRPLAAEVRARPRAVMSRTRRRRPRAEGRPSR